MTIECKEFKLNLDYNEAWTIAYSVKRDIEHTLSNHYINHQDNWKKNEDYKLKIARELFYHLGRPDIYEDIFKHADKAFEEFNNKAN